MLLPVVLAEIVLGLASHALDGWLHRTASCLPAMCCGDALGMKRDASHRNPHRAGCDLGTRIQRVMVSTRNRVTAVPIFPPQTRKKEDPRPPPPPPPPGVVTLRMSAVGASRLAAPCNTHRQRIQLALWTRLHSHKPRTQEAKIIIQLRKAAFAMLSPAAGRTSPCTVRRLPHWCAIHPSPPPERVDAGAPRHRRGTGQVARRAC